MAVTFLQQIGYTFAHTTSMKILDQQSDRAECKVAAENGPDLLLILASGDLFE
jgi:hypothetical protein